MTAELYTEFLFNAFYQDLFFCYNNMSIKYELSQVGSALNLVGLKKTKNWFLIIFFMIFLARFIDPSLLISI